MRDAAIAMGVCFLLSLGVIAASLLQSGCLLISKQAIQATCISCHCTQRYEGKLTRATGLDCSCRPEECARP